MEHTDNGTKVKSLATLINELSVAGYQSEYGRTPYNAISDVVVELDKETRVKTSFWKGEEGVNYTFANVGSEIVWRVSKVTASQKRTNLVGMVIASMYDSDDMEWNIPDVAVVIDRIRELASAGKTDAWKNAVAKWERMVEKDLKENPTSTWAILQGSVYMIHAA